VVVGCIVEVSAYVEDVAVINGSVDDGSDVVVAEDVIAVSGTEAYKQTCQLTKFSYIRLSATSPKANQLRQIEYLYRNYSIFVAITFLDSNVTTAFWPSSLSHQNALNLIINNFIYLYSVLWIVKKQL